MSCSRRDFLKQACGGTLATVLPVSAFTFLSTEEARAAVDERERALGVPRRHQQMRWLRSVRQGVQERERNSVRCAGHAHLGRTLRGHEGRPGPHRFAHGRPRRFHRERHQRRGDRSGEHRQGVLRAEALQPVRQSALRAGVPRRRDLPDGRRRRAGRPQTGASAAATASWPARTACASSTRFTRSQTSATSATTGSRKA